MCRDLKLDMHAIPPSIRYRDVYSQTWVQWCAHVQLLSILITSAELLAVRRICGYPLQLPPSSGLSVRASQVIAGRVVISSAVHCNVQPSLQLHIECPILVLGVFAGSRFFITDRGLREMGIPSLTYSRNGKSSHVSKANDRALQSLSGILVPPRSPYTSSGSRQSPKLILHTPSPPINSVQSPLPR